MSVSVLSKKTPIRSGDEGGVERPWKQNPRNHQGVKNEKEKKREKRERRNVSKERQKKRRRY